MRPRVAAAALLAGALALAVIWWMRGAVGPARSLPPSPPTAVPDANASPPSTQDKSQTPPTATADAQATSPAASPATAQPIPSLDSVKDGQQQAQLSAPQREAFIRSRINALEDLAAENDPGSLQTILSELTNPERAIRAAALESTIQFGSRDAIPKLKEVAAATDDPKEKVALLEAAEFLELPSLTEIRARIKQKKAAQQSGAPPPPPTPPPP